MDKIQVERNSFGDSRTAKSVPTIDQFINANRMHRLDVKYMMYGIANDIKKRGCEHDWTKSSEPYRSIFYRDLCGALEGKMKFDDGEWAKIHCVKERHHLLRNCPEDVNLIDVIEMICDCVCAGLARSGQFRELEINDDILRRAVQNTVQMCLDSVELV